MLDWSLVSSIACIVDYIGRKCRINRTRKNTMRKLVNFLDERFLFSTISAIFKRVRSILPFIVASCNVSCAHVGLVPRGVVESTNSCIVGDGTTTGTRHIGHVSLYRTKILHNSLYLGEMWFFKHYITRF